MQFSLLRALPLSLLLTITAAQTTTWATSYTPYIPTSSECAAKPVVDACLASTKAIAESCASTDYNCLCAKWNEVVVCFNTCPDDARLTANKYSAQSYCANASIYTSATMSAVSVDWSSTATTTSGTAAQTTESGAVRAQTTGGASPTQTGARSSETAKSSGRRTVIGMGGVLGVVASVVVVFL